LQRLQIKIVVSNFSNSSWW